jgi:tRNA threonylcarbamoyladenosine biosynthesis protein TsaE
MAMVLESRSAEETEALGRALGRVLTPGSVVGVAGPIGAGKSVFCRGALAVLTGLNVFPSPTYQLVHAYPGNVVHLDLYRLEDEGEDLAEWLLPPALALVEWPERAPWLLPRDHLAVVITPGPSGRTLKVSEQGPASAALLAAWLEGGG